MGLCELEHKTEVCNVQVIGETEATNDPNRWTHEEKGRLNSFGLTQHKCTTKNKKEHSDFRMTCKGPDKAFDKSTLPIFDSTRPCKTTSTFRVTNTLARRESHKITSIGK